MPKGSAAYITVIVAILTFIIGAFVFTVTDPLIQAVFSSPLGSASTEHGKNALAWQARIWAFAPVGVLISILMTVWVGTRQPT